MKVDSKRSLLIVPLLLWIPMALLRYVGLQAAKSGEEAAAVIRSTAIITITLIIVAAFGIKRVG